MCDTIVAMPASTANRSTLFGKNSDRQRNEAQGVEYFRSLDHEAGSSVACTYLTIPQVPHTFAVLLCRPFWMWGAEMGANEHGVAIGNEGLHARIPPPTAPALTGMDLLRLALERASTAAEAVTVITTLLERHGQGGNCGHLIAAHYNNGFIIADATEAFVLETLGREWIVEQVRDVRAISNTYSIGRGAHAVSTGLHRLLRDSGLSTECNPHYAAAIADPFREHIGNAGARRACSTALMSSRRGSLNALDMMTVLRNHGSSELAGTDWQPETVAERTVCMHAGDHDRAGQTVGSFLAEIGLSRTVSWVTGTAAPCISIFKPVLLDTPLPMHGPPPTGRFDPATLWWRHECLHRAAVLGNLRTSLEEIRAERDALEADFHRRVAAVLGDDAAERARVIAECWRRAMAAEQAWSRGIELHVVRRDSPDVAAWKEMNRIAGFELPAQ